MNIPIGAMYQVIRNGRKHRDPKGNLAFSAFMLALIGVAVLFVVSQSGPVQSRYRIWRQGREYARNERLGREVMRLYPNARGVCFADGVAWPARSESEGEYLCYEADRHGPNVVR